jgi:hypothetical protein
MQITTPSSIPILQDIQHGLGKVDMTIIIAIRRKKTLKEIGNFIVKLGIPCIVLMPRTTR